MRSSVRSFVQQQAWRKFFVLAAGSVILAQATTASARQNSFVCLHPDNKAGGIGVWKGACDANQFGDTSRVKLIYPKFIIDRRTEDPDKQKKYVTAINSLVKQVAKKYILQRKPEASSAEVAGFQEAALAIAMHETYMSHYRISEDGRLKLMTGDQLNSHGMMQVNQKYHATRLDGLDSSLDLVGNIVTALDVYYTDGWRRVVEKPCFASFKKDPIEARARGAYSAYNGGPDAVCRFANSKSIHRGKDQGYVDKLRHKPWLEYVTQDMAPTGLKIDSLMAGDDLGAMAAPAARGEYLKSRPVLLADGKTCVTADGTNFQCAEDMRIFSCMAKIDTEILDADPVKMTKLPDGTKSVVVTDRESLCKRAVKDLFTVGSKIVLQQEIVIRKAVGGRPLGSARAGRVYQVLDYDIRLGGKSERYYKVKTSTGADVWIFGGNNEDVSEWVKLASDSDELKSAEAKEAAKAQAAEAATKPAVPPTTGLASNSGSKPGKSIQLPTVQIPAIDEEAVPLIPTEGSIVEVIMNDGIALRPVAGSKKEPILKNIREGVRLKVDKVVKIGSENEIYLEVDAGGITGYIYAGHTFPTVTVNQWIKLWK